MRTPSLRTAVAALAVATLVAAGCGDDDDEAAGGSSDTTEAPADTGSTDEAAYCGAELAVEMVPAPEIDFATATEEEVAAGYQAWAAETMQPLAEGVVAVAPADVKDDIDVLSAAVEQVAAGNPSAFETPDVAAAGERVHQYDLDTCGWASLEVSAKDYEFVDVPAELPAGPTSFEFSNDGAEVHELILAKKNEGVTDSAEDLLALPEEEAMSKIAIIGEPAFALPGEGDYKVTDLEPGDYIAVCFIPTGMTSDDGPPPEGPPHFTHGMVTEFSVS